MPDKLQSRKVFFSIFLMERPYIDFKLADEPPIIKKNIVLKKKIIDGLVYYHICQKYLKESFINKLVLS